MFGCQAQVEAHTVVCESRPAVGREGLSNGQRNALKNFCTPPNGKQKTSFFENDLVKYVATETYHTIPAMATPETTREKRQGRSGCCCAIHPQTTDGRTDGRSANISTYMYSRGDQTEWTEWMTELAAMCCVRVVDKTGEDLRNNRGKIHPHYILGAMIWLRLLPSRPENILILKSRVISH